MLHRPVERLPEWVRCTYALAGERARVLPDAGQARLTVPFVLQPAQWATLRFVLAWHQPHLREGSGRVEKHRYAERFADAKAVAATAVAKHADWLGRVLAWQDAIYGCDLPDWPKEELVNVLSTLTRNSVWLARTGPKVGHRRGGAPLPTPCHMTVPSVAKNAKVCKGG